MKKIFIISIFIIILFYTFFYFTKHNLDNSVPQNEVNKPISQAYSYEYFSAVSQDFYYGNDMTFMNSIYYKVILNFDEYTKYKTIYPDIIDMNNKDFETNFLVLTVVENESTKNLGLENITVDETTLYVGLNKKTINEEPDLNKGISIKIDKNLLKENIDVFKTIKNTDFMTNYCDIKQLPKDYSIEDAIKDNCFVLTTNPATNTNLLEKLLNNVQNEQNSELRIIGKEIMSDSMIVYDVKYVAADKKYYVCVDTSRGNNSNSYNYFEYDALNKIEDNNSSIIIINPEKISMFEFSNINFPETNLKFSFYNSYYQI